jgi:hypothetical protein
MPKATDFADSNPHLAATVANHTTSILEDAARVLAIFKLVRQ